MPNDPERDIEKSLRAFARQRRKASGAPMELHPATRGLLQREAARLASPAPPSVWHSVQWRLAFGGALGLVLAIAVIVLRGDKPRPADEMRLAKVESFAKTPPPKEKLTAAQSEAAGSPAPAAPAPTAAPPPASVFVPETPGPAPESAPAVEFKFSQNAPAQATADRGLEPARPQVFYRRGPGGGVGGGVTPTPGVALKDVPSLRLADNLSLAPGPAPAGAAEPLTTLALPGGNEQAPAAKLPISLTASEPAVNSRAQQFRQAAQPATRSPKLRAATAGAAPVSGVLDSFSLERVGAAELQLVDADGSTYTGVLGRSDAAGAQDGNFDRIAGAKALARSGPQVLSPAVYYFRVQGTNRTLNQLVRFSGELVPSPTAARNQLSPVVVKAGEISPSPAPPPPPLDLSHVQMQGRARVGDGPEIPINAVPAAK